MSLEHSHGECGMVQVRNGFARLGVKAKKLFGLGTRRLSAACQTEFPGGYSEWEPPDPFSNSEVKTLRADDSVAAAMRE